MGFLKKKPSVKLPNGSELVRTSSAKSFVGSPPATNSLPATIEEGRDEDGTSSRLFGTETDIVKAGDSVSTAAPSRTSAASLGGRDKEAREKPAHAKSSSGKSPPKPRKKHSSGGGGATGGSNSKKPTSSNSAVVKAKTKTKDASHQQHQQHRKSRKDGTTAAASERKSRSRTTSPVQFGFKKAPGTDKKKHRQQRQRSRGRSQGPATAGKSSVDLERIITKNKPSKIKNSPSSKSTLTGATPKISNGKKSTSSSNKPGRSKKRSVSRSRSASRSKSRPSPGHHGRTARGVNTFKKRLQQQHQLSYDDSYGSSSSSESSYDSCSDYTGDDDEYTTGNEDSTMYTDGSESFVSIGYNTTEDSGNHTNGISASTSGDTDADTTGDEGVGMEVSPHSFRSRGTAGFTSSFESYGEKSKMKSNHSKNSVKSASPKVLGQMAKDSLTALGNLSIENKAKNNENKEESDKNNTDDDGNGTSNDERSLSDGTADETLSAVESSTAAKSLELGHADFMKKMQEFEAINEDHQLVVQVTEHGNVEKLLLQEISYIPKPSKPDEIVIKVDCSTITLQDCMIRRGKWYEMQKLPFVPGADFVGTIYEMGEEATNNSTFQVGDKVAAVVPSGGNAKYISIEYQSIIRVPNEVDSVVALCLSSTYVPAREALDLARKLNTPFTGANILIIGGNGPSGLATIELALLEGANVFTTADGRHHEYLTNLGARCFPIDPNKWLPTLQGKMDVVLDSVCLDGYDSSSLALNPSGKLVCTGMSAVYTQGQIRAFGMKDVRDYKAMYCRMRARYLLNNTLYYDRMERYDLAPNEYAQHFRYLCHLASKDTITPLVSARAPLNLVASMQKAIEHGDTTYGVCVCVPWSTKTDPDTDPGTTPGINPGNAS
mmetsp:Transcript_7355/g.16667  ORF Transcript_7355/g.16667 Transcript_7355/m.16667 type:complete len:888 (-) Transcript_7355:257-2920(-)|eukprot:CAMPEP_0172317766 /NCGR_PEP_ID=MMETSP1058-20130122/32676_1 /TAXON_ID=83371 /ORGANISM="Detonula confervacea, Strain CCMP 353" /LENGTH=887 /DNA_ID=CAMNT_0013032397 /DNA_START=108 /DNA_END=2771 /DNA_ORIENTATION=-